MNTNFNYILNMFKFFLKSGLAIQTSLCVYAYYNSIFKSKSDCSYDHEKFKHRYNIIKNDPINKLNKPLNRDKEIEKLQKENFDILIIGGGCSGTGVLIDAYSRGLKCAIIEANDFSSGTSSRSTKLIHGGIRYLQDAFSFSGGQYEKIKLVFEALKERDFLISSAPFMNNLIEIKFPFSNIFQMCYYLDGLILYQLIYAFHSFPNFNLIFPGPRMYYKDKMVSFFEGQMIDARQNLLSILATTIERNNLKPSSLSNYVELRDYIYDDKNKIVGVKAFDKINEKEITIYSDVVVNCTGIYADNMFSKEDSLRNKMITSSKGTHLVINKNIFNLKSGYMIPRTTDGRILFVLPYYQKDYFIIGTTDEQVQKSATPGVLETEVEYIINELKSHFNISEETIRNSISSKWSGIRPLVSIDNNNNNNLTKTISRNHVVRYDDVTGLVSLLGGKWTTYRKMGEDVLEKIISKNENIKKKIIKKNIDKFRVAGGFFISQDFEEENEFFMMFKNYLTKEYSVEYKYVDDLVKKYGVNAEIIIENMKKINNNDKFVSDKDLSELNYSLDYEMVIKPNDFICRRTGNGFIEFENSKKEIPLIAKLLAKRFKWSNSKLNNEITEANEKINFMI